MSGPNSSSVGAPRCASRGPEVGAGRRPYGRARRRRYRPQTAVRGGRAPPRLTAVPDHRRELPRAAAGRRSPTRRCAAPAELGCSHADVRIERIRSPTGSATGAAAGARTEVLGLSVRVLHEGVWGFAAGIASPPSRPPGWPSGPSPPPAVSRPLTPVRIELADEPVHTDAGGSRRTSRIRSTYRRPSGRPDAAS